MRHRISVEGSQCERTKDKRRRGTDPRQRTLSTTPTGTTANSNPSPRPSWNGPGPTRAGLCSTLAAGRGATTLATAATAERAVGVDLSRPLVELARRRAQAAKIANTEFVIADAQTHDFATGTFDVLISRFGLMFFDDPVRAFTNIRRSLNDDARAAFVSWQGLHANEWLMVIANAVSRHAELPEFGGQARGPGMFALSEPDEVTTLLGAAGFDQVECDSYTPTIVLGGGGGLDDSVDFLLAGGMPRGLLGLVDPSAADDVLRNRAHRARRSLRRRGRDSSRHLGVGGHRPGVARGLREAQGTTTLIGEPMARHCALRSKPLCLSRCMSECSRAR